MLTALNIGPRVRDGCGRREPTNEEIIKGKRIMNALQEIFDRKLIRQARANRRGIKLPR